MVDNNILWVYTHNKIATKKRGKGRAVYLIKLIYINIMPKFDRTGPRGMGPGTGRGMGPCAGGFGGGYGMGCGRGFGGRQFFSRKEESEMLEDEVEDLENEMKAIKERIAELKAQK